MKPTVILVDAMSYIFRAYYGQDEVLSPEGKPVGAAFGFLQFLLRLLDREQPSHLAIVFDAGPRTFRNEIYEDYKANRSETPEDLLPQFEYCEKIVSALGIPLFREEGFEADDVLATLAETSRKAGFAVTLVSGDKDLAQLVDEDTLVLDPARNRKLNDRTVRRRFGIAPGYFTDWLALVGDSSDNLPGVPGIGPKGATALVDALGGLEQIYDSINEVEKLPVRGATSLRRKLDDHREQAFLMRQLVTLRRDVPLTATPLDLEYRGALREDCDKVLQPLGLASSMRQIRHWRAK